MAINLGSTSISNAYLGSSGVTAIYLGTNQVWTSAAPIPIGPNTFKIGGLGGTLTSASLASKLTGVTLTYFVSQSGYIYVSSSTNYTINSSAFLLSASLTSYIDGGRCTSINSNAFNFSGIVSASFPNATTIGSSAFKDSAIQYLDFPKVTNISSDAFSGTAITSVTEANFPSASTIGVNAFIDCASLVSASFLRATTVGSYAFAQFAAPPGALSYVYLPSLSGPNALGGSTGDDSVFLDVATGGQIYVPSYYSQSNAGGLDGDLSYLSSSLNWTINWL